MVLFVREWSANRNVEREKREERIRDEGIKEGRRLEREEQEQRQREESNKS